MDQESYLNELDRIPFPTINYRSKINLGLSVVNFFGLALGLFMMSAPMMGWIGYESPSLGTAYMFGGFCQYLIGFYDWFQGRTMLSFIDFIYGLLHFAFYYTADLGKYEIPVPYEYVTYMQGVFYCLWFALLVILVIGFVNQGTMHRVYVFLLALGCIFLIIWEFSGDTWARKTAGYIIFITSILIWYTGLARLIFNVSHVDCLPFASRYWNIWKYEYENGYGDIMA
jgi:succinate-acetate transporter protein